MEVMIKKLQTITPLHNELLFEADPDKNLINHYLQRSFCFEAVSGNQELVGVVVLLPTHPKTLEIVNIAVTRTHRNKGVGSQLLAFAEKYARQHDYDCLEIGTGTTSFEQLYLYQKCGFRVIGVDRDYFIHHYNHDIIEHNLVLKDMIRLQKVLH